MTQHYFASGAGCCADSDKSQVITNFVFQASFFILFNKLDPFWRFEVSSINYSIRRPCSAIRKAKNY